MQFKTIKSNLTLQIILAMMLGAIFGLSIKYSPEAFGFQRYFTDGILEIGGAFFINAIKMLVVPLVFVSLLCGICSLSDLKKLGRIGLKAFGWIVITTVLAITLGILFANFLQVGDGANLPLLSDFKVQYVPSLKNFLINIVPQNPIASLANTDILSIIFFAIIFGLAINLAGESGKRVASFFQDLNVIIAKAVAMIMRFTPFGVFCLLAVLFAKTGFTVILQLLKYFFVVLLVLFLHTVFTYGLLLKVFAKLKIKFFFRKMREVLLFSFCLASSNASLPITLETVEKKLGVDNSIASFVLSLGINMNKNGTAIMQGVAAIFIANAYHVDIGLLGNFLIILTATLASISTAGVPSVGVFALVIVLKQLSLPIEGIAMILAVDRLLDMARTPVNVAGNAVIACLVAKSEDKIDREIYEKG